MVDPIISLGKGRYLELITRGKWESVRRINSNGVTAIIAVTEARELLLVEQFRPALNKPCIELPAGLVGDDNSSEAALAAAQRELEEETGYRAENWTSVFKGASSAGLTDETIEVFLATRVMRVGPGGGDRDEAITVHAVPLIKLQSWLDEKARSGHAIDVKIYAAPWIIETTM